MKELNEVDKKKIETVMNLFLNWNIGDVYKVVNIEVMVGATILAMCVIQSVAQFSLETTDGTQFIWFVENYLKNVNKFPYKGIEIYALRCSLIKEYALIARFGEKNKPIQITKFALTEKMPHFMKSEFGTLFNIKQFTVDIQLATQQFFIDILTNKLPNKYAEKVILYHDTKKIGPITKISN